MKLEHKNCHGCKWLDEVKSKKVEKAIVAWLN